MKLLLFFIFICFSTTAGETNKNIQSEFEVRFEKYSKLIKTIKCDFTQEKTMQVFEKPVLMRGNFYYDSKGDICLEYLNPIGNMIIFSGEKFMMQNSGKKTVADLSSNSMLRQLSEMLSACMTGDISKFRVGWSIDYAENGAEYIVTLTPTNRRVARMINCIVLYFVKSDMSLSQMKMIENGGDMSAYTFSNKMINKELNANIFKLN